ncbi:MAG: hypothetical protein E7162_05100 [Firmicutes bacterium]|nr:hypothetical protein [Bacillota bacterium]
MKKKILLALILSFTLITLSGCTAEYTLKYENDTFTEIVNIRGEKEDQAHPTYESIKTNGYKADVDGKEDFVLSEDSSRFDVTLTHELKDVKLNKLKAVSECFTLNTYKESENSYYISLYGNFTCDNLTNSTFTLETDAKVATENSHKKEGNKYIWNLEEEKLKDGIKFQIIKPELENIKIGSDTMFSTTAKIIIALIIIGIVVGLFLILKKTNEG